MIVNVDFEPGYLWFVGDISIVHRIYKPNMDGLINKYDRMDGPDGCYGVLHT